MKKTVIHFFAGFIICTITPNVYAQSGGVWGALQGAIDTVTTEINTATSSIQDAINGITGGAVTLPGNVSTFLSDNAGDPVDIGKKNDYLKLVQDADNSVLMKSMPDGQVSIEASGDCLFKCNVQCTTVIPPGAVITTTFPSPYGVKTEMWLADYFLEVVRHRGTSTMPNLRNSLKDLKSGSRSAGAGAEQGFYHVHIFPKFGTAAGTFAGAANLLCHLPAVAQSPYLSELDAYWSPGNSDTPLVKFTEDFGKLVGSVVGDTQLGESLGGDIGNTLIYMIQLGTTVDLTSQTNLAAFTGVMTAMIAKKPAIAKTLLEGAGYFHMLNQALSMEECVALSISKKANAQGWNMGAAGCQGPIGALNGFAKGEPAVVATLLAQRALTLMHARVIPTLPSTAASWLGLVPSVQWVGASKDVGLCMSTDGPGRYQVLLPGLEKTDYKLWMLHPVADDQPKRLGESPYIEKGTNLFKQLWNLSVEKQKKNPPQGADYVFMVLKKRVCCASTWQPLLIAPCNGGAIPLPN